jgi:hypothetical protein
MFVLSSLPFEILYQCIGSSVDKIWLFYKKNALKVFIFILLTLHSGFLFF